MYDFPAKEDLGYDEKACTSQPRLLVWSAFDDATLKSMLIRFREHLTEIPKEIKRTGFLDDLAWTLSSRRSHLPCRFYTVSTSVEDLSSELEVGNPKPTRGINNPRICFVFTGQGAQWPRMGVELLSYPAYEQSLQLAGLHLRNLGCQFNIIDEILNSESHSNLDSPVYSQTICTALQVGLVDLLNSWGISPTAIIGHSSGEIAAAYSAGAICRESAWTLAYHRGRVADIARLQSSIRFAMMAVGLTEQDMHTYLDRTQSTDEHISIACFNSPTSITVSGSENRIDAIKLVLEGEGIFCRKLKVDVAYHTTYMTGVSSLYQDLIQDLSPSGSETMMRTMFSSVTGQLLNLDQVRHGSYWKDNLISPVKFQQAVENMFAYFSSRYAEDNVAYLLEVGPHSTLGGSLKQILKTVNKAESTSYSSVLTRGKSASMTALEAMGQLFCRGFPADVAKINRLNNDKSTRTSLVNLPSYPWNHTKKYWLESRISKSYKFRKFTHHKLLGTPVRDWNHLKPRWRYIIKFSENPWIRDHKVLQIRILHHEWDETQQ